MSASEHRREGKVDDEQLAELESTFLSQEDRRLLASLDERDSLNKKMASEGFITEELLMEGESASLAIRHEICLNIAVKAADSLIEVGKLDQAEQAARKLLERFPDRYDGWACLGNISRGRGDRTHAADCFRKVIECIRNHPEHYSPESVTVWRKLVDESAPPNRLRGNRFGPRAYTTEMEPDQDQGFCEACGGNTVTSALVLAGLI
jgi:tetratricopeptide (TPR) repeat protein